MTYRELLNLYKTDKLDAETRRQIAADIEKQDAISDYLYEESEIPALSEFPAEAGELPETGGEDQKFAAMMQAAIRRAFLKMGVIAGAAAVAILLAVVFLLPKAVSLFYYNPNAVAGEDAETGQETNRMSLDLAVYTELFQPGAYRGVVRAEPLGYGKYAVSIPQISSFDGNFTSVNGMLTRNRLNLYNPDLFRPLSSNAFLVPEGVKGGMHFVDYDTGEPVGMSGLRSEAYAALDKLDGDEWYLGYVSLKQVMEYADFQRWFSEQELEWGEMWCSAHMENEDGELLGQNIGFLMYPNGSSLDWDREKYPELSLLGGADMADAERMQTHFLSLLRYMQDHARFVNMMQPETGMDAAWAEMMIDSIERDGLRVNGFMLLTHKDTLLRLRNSQEVSYISTKPAAA